MRRLLVLAAMAAPFAANAQEVAVRDWLRRAEGFGWSGAVALVQNGRPVLMRGFGLGNRETGERATPETAFYVASLTKQFTAAAILRLQSQGHLRIADSLHRYFPEAQGAVRNLTIHQLLRHTSGIARGDDINATDATNYVAQLLSRPLRSAPGEQYRYSNDGYAVLAALLERVSHASYATVLTRELFLPAGMRRTFVVSEPPPHLPTTRAYRGGIEMGDVRATNGAPIRWGALGGTGVVTTVSDLVAWDRALRGTLLLPDDAKRAMWTPGLEEYGYGWVIQPTLRGTSLQVHDGLLYPQGWNSEIRRWPEDGISLIVLSNAFREEPLGHLVARDLSRLIFGGAVVWPPEAGPVPSAALGRYRNADGAELLVRQDGSGTTLEARGQLAVNALRYGTVDTARHREDNARTGRLVTALAGRSLAGVAGILDSTRTVAQWEQRLFPLWDSLVARHGSFQAAEVLHSFSPDSDTTSATSFAALRFQPSAGIPTVAVIVRYNWSNGLLVGASDWASFPGAIRSVEPVPGPMPLRTGIGGSLVTWDFSTGRARWIRAVRDPQGGIVGLDVVMGDGTTVRFTRQH